jgi:glutamate synthase (NADPH/NADH) large chain
MIGRVDRLEPRRAITHWKAKGLDFSNILYQPDVGPEVGRFCQIQQDHGIAQSLDMTQLLELCRPPSSAARRSSPNCPSATSTASSAPSPAARSPASTAPRACPRTPSAQVHRLRRPELRRLRHPGMTLTIEGDANDYFGKGLSGGKLIIYPPANSPFKAEENMIVGNVAFYGASAGEAYIRGLAGERFAVRNSGVTVVVEGVGDNGCEYMTGGNVVVLGRAGRNFGAGMSGGVGYVLDEAGDFAQRVNAQMVGIEKLEDAREIAAVRAMVQKHLDYTKSHRALEVLADWDKFVPKFVKVMPKDYKRMLACLERAKAQGLTGDEAVMAAFEENARDLSRVGGN